jgi:phosphocarrier protein
MGATIELRAEGWDAKEALEALSGLVEAGFHEQD